MALQTTPHQCGAFTLALNQWSQTITCHLVSDLEVHFPAVSWLLVFFFFFGGLSGGVMGWSICALELLTPPLSSLSKPVLILSQILALVLEPRETGTHPSCGSKAVLGLSSISEHAFF